MSHFLICKVITAALLAWWMFAEDEHVRLWNVWYWGHGREGQWVDGREQVVMASPRFSKVAPQYVEPKAWLTLGYKKGEATCSIRNPRKMANGTSDPMTGERWLCCKSYKFLCLLGMCQQKSSNTPHWHKWQDYEQFQSDADGLPICFLV